MEADELTDFILSM